MREQGAATKIVAVLRKRNSLLAEKLTQGQTVSELPKDIREAIVDELGKEFSESGVGPDGEPNEWGLELELLTDACDLAKDGN